jgi:CRP-like cAMP-binding protein
VQPLIETLLSPGAFLGHASYALLVLSMMMRNIIWLRVIAIGAGVVGIAYDVFVLEDPVSTGWDTLFVLANVYQLLYLAWQARKVRFNEEEFEFCQNAMPLVPPSLARQFINVGEWRDMPEGTELTAQGQTVTQLTYIATGTVDVLVHHHHIATCVKGDFIGELGILSGKPATATTVTSSPVRALIFERDKLLQHLRHEPDLKLALQAAFKENLRNKLTLANERTLAFRGVEPAAG